MDPVILISAAVFLGVVALIAAVSFIMKDMGSSKAENRLAVMTGQKSASASQGVLKDDLVRGGSAGLATIAGKVADRFGSLPKLFRQADAPLRIDTFLGICIGTGLLGLAGSMIARAPFAIHPVAFVMGAMLPWGWLLFRRKRRMSRFESQLPDALELIGRALRSGHSLASGLNVVCDEMPEPISTEFSVAFEEQNLGIPIEKALKNMLDRVPNLDLKFFVTAVAIQRQSGGDLAEILDKIGHIIRERFQILGQVKALTGEGRMSGIVLMALPIALFFAVYYLNPEYMMLLFTEELGRKMIFFAFILQLIGAYVIKKIIDIKV
ncbi:MAG: type II secretion system F family protein [Planctomycetaceae bacterium]